MQVEVECLACSHMVVEQSYRTGLDAYIQLGRLLHGW